MTLKDFLIALERIDGALMQLIGALKATIYKQSNGSAPQQGADFQATRRVSEVQRSATSFQTVPAPTTQGSAPQGSNRKSE